MSKWFDVQLPSKGLPYDVDVSEIKMTYTTGEVEELISGMTYDNYETRSFAILNKILKGIDPKKLTLGDRQALLIQNTVNTYSKYVPVDLVCNHCGCKHSDHNVDLTTVDLNDIESEGFEKRKVIRCFGKKAYVRLFTLGDQLQVEKYLEDGGTLEYLFSASKMVDIVKEVNDQGEEVFYDDIEKFDLFKNGSPKEYNELKLYGSKYDHGSFMTYKFKCQGCSQEAVAIIPFLLSFLYPSPEVVQRSMDLEAKECAKDNDKSVSESELSDGEGVSDTQADERCVDKGDLAEDASD